MVIAATSVRRRGPRRGRARARRTARARDARLASSGPCRPSRRRPRPARGTDLHRRRRPDLGRGARRPRRPDRRRRRRRATSTTWSGRATRVIELRGRTVTPGFGDSHVHPVSAGHRAAAVRPQRARAAATPTSTPSPRTRPRTRTSSGSPAAAGRMPAFPGGLARREDLDRVAPGRPVLLLDRRRPRRLGELAGAGAAPGVDRDTADPDDGRIARDPDGTPLGTLHEGAMHLVDRLIPDPDARTSCAARSSRARRTSTASGSRTGRTRSWSRVEEAAYRSLGGVGRAHGARRRGAVVGARRGPRADRVARGAARGPGPIGPVLADERQADDRRDHREPDRLDAPAVPRRPRARDRQPGQGLHRPARSCARSWSGSTPSGSSRTSTRWATGPSARRWTRSRPPGRRTAGATPGRTSPTSRSSTPTTCRASDGSGRSRTRSRCGPCSRRR